MKKSFVALALIISVTAILFFCWRADLWNHRLTVKAYFQDVQGLRAGAQVRLAGVPVGHVKSVQAIPERIEAPAQVVMEISTPYELNIPSDSTVTVQTAGILSQPFVEIEIAGTHGPPLSSGAILKSQSGKPSETQTLLDALGNALKPCGQATNDTSGKKDTGHKTERLK